MTDKLQDSMDYEIRSVSISVTGGANFTFYDSMAQEVIEFLRSQGFSDEEITDHCSWHDLKDSREVKPE